MLRLLHRWMSRTASAIATGTICLFTITPAGAAPEHFPAALHVKDIAINGATYHVRVGGTGPAVVLLHGFGDTGDMWAPLAAALIKGHTLVIPDLRGMGLSSHAAAGYDKKSQGQDIAKLMETLGIAKADLVTHDIGNMVGYATAVQFPDRISRWVVMDAPLPGIGAWEKQLSNPKVWHFNFQGPDVERLVKGRERIYLDRFYNELSYTPRAIDEATRAHYAALYARPGNMHAAFNQFAAFKQDAIDNPQLLASTGKLSMPVLAVGGDHSYGTALADDIRSVATDVTPAVIADSGHWIMEEQPAAAVALIAGWLNKPLSDVGAMAK